MNTSGEGTDPHLAALEFIKYFSHEKINCDEIGQYILSPDTIRKTISTIILDGVD